MKTREELVKELQELLDEFHPVLDWIYVRDDIRQMFKDKDAIYFDK